MTGAELLARSVTKSLACAIEQHRAQHRRPPERVFAELSAYYALKMDGVATHNPIGNRMIFMGVPVEPIGREGMDIYLCGERVEIHLHKEEEL